MITALISTITGLVSGTVPNLLKEWGASRECNREVETLQKPTQTLTLQSPIMTMYNTAIMGQFDTFARTTMVRAMTATGKAIFRQFRAWSMHRTRACN